MESNTNNFLPPSISVSTGLEPEIKITDFEKLADLGKGGYGEVNLYRHKVTGGEYAIKLIDKTKFKEKKDKELFSREIDMMYKIRHPNIVRLYTHFEDESKCYIVLEYIKKGNLFDYRNSMNNKALDAATTANFVVDLISSLYYLHNMNPPIIHRDIKPENLLIGNNGHLKLTDFGISNYLEGSVRYTKIGTNDYFSPEMILRKGYDTRVDIWAIGILIFELLVGSAPFKKDDQQSTEDNITHGRIKWPNSMNLFAKNLITKILKSDPNQRPTLEEILDHQFILTYVQNPKSRLILPSEVEIIPFVISKQLPGQESLKNEANNNFNTNIIYSDNGEYKSLYENLKIAYEKLKKEKEELSDKKKENDIKIKQIRKYMEDSKKMLEKELDDKMNDYLDAKMVIALNEEKIKSLEQQISLLEEKNQKLEKDLLNSENNNKLKANKYKDDIKIYQEKIIQIIQGKITDKTEIESLFLEYSDNNMLSLYKKENDNLKQQNSKLLKDIDKLNEKLSAQQEDNNIKEQKRNDILNQLLKENKVELEKKNNTINKLYNVLADISHFMDKIKVKNFMLTFDGNNLNNMENIRRLLYNIQPGAKSNTRSTSNSKDDVYSNKRKTNVQRSSASGSLNYFN